MAAPTTTKSPTTTTAPTTTAPTTTAPGGSQADTPSPEAIAEATAACLVYANAAADSAERIRFNPGSDFADLVVPLTSLESSYVLGASEGQRFLVSAVSQRPIEVLVCLSGSKINFLRGQLLTANSTDFEFLSDDLPSSQDYFLTIAPINTAGESEFVVRVYIPPRS